MKKGKLIALTLLAALIFCGCSAVNIRTKVLSGQTNEESIIKGRAFELSELIPANMELKEFVGFDEQNRAVGWFTKGENYCIMVFDTENRVGQQVLDTHKEISSVLLAGDSAILYETVSGSERELSYIRPGSDTPVPLAQYTADSSAIAVRHISDTDQIYVVCRAGEKLKFMVISASGPSVSSYDITDMIRKSAGEYYFRSAELADMCVDSDGRISVLITVDGSCYMWTGMLTRDGRVSGSIILECGGTMHVCTGGAIYYVDAEGRLMLLDAEKNEQSVIAENAAGFSISADEQIIAYSRASGVTKRVYAKRINSAEETLLEISQGGVDFILNGDGSRMVFGRYGREGASPGQESEYWIVELEH